MKVSGSQRARLRAVLVAALSALLFAGLVGTASAAPSTEAPSASAGRSIPASKVSIQLWTFAEYIGLGSDAATQARHEEVLRRLSEMGYRNVEPFTLSGFTAEQYAALLREYRLKASGRHVDVGAPESPVDITPILEENRILGIGYFGSGSTPRTYTTEAQWTAYAQYLDTLGAQARTAGQTLMTHNHNWEFAALGDGRTGFEILMQHTEPRNVVFQLDLYWATFAGADPVQLVEEYGDRIQLFHVKDLNPTLDDRIEIVGRGSIDFPAVFAAAGGSTRYFVVEHDPRFGDPTFDPFEAAREGFAYLTCTSY
ncbi:sugar phosphate isomerase/epimerase family protein [Geodermatophilus sp. URMC 61]|uniref:sugar phosphate isomerase/epimerase family protein n=1 Tax=Geodermatophilus sp. URMC 61 TaxID=3423411 RepID=UPI00406C9EE9